MSLPDCTPESLAARLASAPALVLEIWGDWCPNCRVLAAILERMQPEYAGRVDFVRLNHGKHPEVGDGLGVRSLPALVFYREGRMIELRQGFIGAPVLGEHLRAIYGVPAP